MAILKDTIINGELNVTNSARGGHYADRINNSLCR